MAVLPMPDDLEGLFNKLKKPKTTGPARGGARHGSGAKEGREGNLRALVLQGAGRRVGEGPPLIFGENACWLKLLRRAHTQLDHGHLFVADICSKVNYVDCKTFAAGRSASPWGVSLCRIVQCRPFEPACRFGALAAYAG